MPTLDSYRSTPDTHKRNGSGSRLTAILAAATLFSAVGTSMAAAAPAGPQWNGAPVPVLSWSDCTGGFECSDAAVPLDYRDPAGRTITLHMIRHRAADPTHRVGTLWMEPGGPGSSGLSFARDNYDDLPSALRDRFDIVSFDPRGIGTSSQVECYSDAQYDAAVGAAKGVPGPDAFDTAVKVAADFDQNCVTKLGDTAGLFGTQYVARDIDLLRQALGEQQLTFYGRSFGTYVGTVYASMFPRRVRAMALDGAYDPKHYANQPYAYDEPQYLALDAAMDDFLDWCAQNQTSCGFGDGDPKAAFTALKADLDANPVQLPSGKQANGFTLAYRLLFNMDAGKVIWPSFGQALHQAQLRDPNSFLLRPPSPASYDQLNPNTVVSCNDRDFPTSLAKLQRHVTASAAEAPLLGTPWAYAPPMYDQNSAPACVQWPVERVSRYSGSYRAAGSAPILVIGTTHDPDTPYQDAVALSRTFDNARLLTFDAEGHTAFGRSACATDAVATYLADLTLPKVGTVCSDEAPPVPVQAAAARTAVAGSGTGSGSQYSELRDGVRDDHELIRAAR
ncbi:alpha/beta hydrolase [Catenulispora yoronensis]|uniref:Alpha/beta hydrolase n=1 Tax=Catenulispora yoronensis TaxID=450799 RepID=A0ABN2U874_9ACTN